MDYAEALKARRRSSVTVGGFTFHVLRPRQWDMVTWQQAGGYAEVAVRSIERWDGVCARDLDPHEDETPVAYSLDLAREWLFDRAELLGPLWAHIEAQIVADAQARDDRRKN